jgi:alkylation response protein AidB-like acyl-CoA dehydrogenase
VNLFNNRTTTAMLTAKALQSQPTTATTDPVAVARGLVPLLAQHADAAERERQARAPVIQALRDAGLLNMMFARRFGGAGHKLITHVETVAELARGCPGSAWAFGLLSGVTGSASAMPPIIRDQIFKRGDELVCSVAGQIGTARATEGGYVVDGAWGYGSGCMHADWALNGIRILDADGKQVDAGFAFLPLAGPDVSIQDTWHMSGLSASGSNTIVARNAFVPTTLVLRFSALRGSRPAADMEPRDRWPVEPLFPLGVLSPMLGAAGAMLEIVRANLPQRPTIGWKYANQADSQTFVGQFGEAALEIDSAWLHVRRAVGMIDETAQTRVLSGFEKARIQADCSYAMRQLRRAGERLMEIAGPGAFATNSPLQRLWRDLSVGSRHTALNAMLSAELYGRALLGQPSNLALLADIQPAA